MFTLQTTKFTCLENLSSRFCYCKVWCKCKMNLEKIFVKYANNFFKELIREGAGFKKPRKGFSESIKKQILFLQNKRCNHCNRLLDVFNFDHIDGNRANNSLFNCQALCPNCHAKKTRKKR